jgi:hypothetical protein
VRSWKAVCAYVDRCLINIILIDDVLSLKERDEKMFCPFYIGGSQRWSICMFGDRGLSFTANYIYSLKLFYM